VNDADHQCRTSSWLWDYFLKEKDVGTTFGKRKENSAGTEQILTGVFLFAVPLVVGGKGTLTKK